MTRPLIEQWLPAASIGAESLRERGSAKAYPPINFLHVWWARRPLVASRAAVIASLLPAWPSREDAATEPHSAKALSVLESEFPGGPAEYRAWFTQLLGIFGDPVSARAAIQRANAEGIRLSGSGYGYNRAFMFEPDERELKRFHRLARLTTESENRPVVLDPFAGGGSIPFEAIRFGCDALAAELNPVAAAILQGTVVLPAAVGSAFAGVIERYGRRWAERVRKRLAVFYPVSGGESIAGYIWAHTVPCPTTGLPTPLVPTAVSRSFWNIALAFPG